MKAGTTFLYDVLRKHPDIFFSHEKELHYFAHTEWLSWRLQQPLESNRFMLNRIIFPRQVLSNNFRRHRLSAVLRRRYAKLDNADALRSIMSWYVDRYMANPVNGAWLNDIFDGAGNRWCADFSNYNALLSDRGWAGVRRQCTKLKVMYVLREPVSRCWSHIKFELLSAGKRDELVNGELSVVNEFLQSTSSAHARYGAVINSLRRNLSKEDLLVVRFEDVVAEPQRELSKIVDFLGVSEFDFSTVNVAAKINSTEALDIPPAVRTRLENALTDEIVLYQNFGSVE
ncbi:sulfotransferase [Nitratireductor sp. XY-223]|uniref:sulfotransferase n=1 Tax=Nitratireductor sp. XY-223 TaxID=2561926 RepID=UPI00145A3D40|nr:sulfotransferase [Nitratireductor sp. XY-223]